MNLSIGLYKTIVSIRKGNIGRSDICFADVRDDFKEDKSIDNINLWLLPKNNNEIDNHHIFVDLKQIKQWINEIKKVYPFTYLIYKTTWKREFAYRIHLTIDGTRTQKLFILTAIRYTYEYPYNAQLLDAFRLKETKEFKDWDLLNLTQYIQVSIWGNKISSPGHALSCSPLFTPIKTLNSRIQNAKKVQDVFIWNYRGYYQKQFAESLTKSEFWINKEGEDAFKNKRLETYKNSINLYK